MNSFLNMYDSLNTFLNFNIVFDAQNVNTNIFSTKLPLWININYTIVVKSLLILYFISFIASCPLFYSIDIATQSISEDDLSSIQDLIIMTLFTASIFLSYITFFAGFYFFKGVQVIVIISFCYLISLILGTIFGVMFNLRYYALIFLNGSGKSKKITYNYLLDVISSVAFNIRICVQLIRIVLLLATYNLCTNLYNELIYNFELSSTIAQNFKLTNYFIVYVRILVELGHVYIIFIMQFAAFFFMIFWLIEFMFVSVTATEKEKSLFQL